MLPLIFLYITLRAGKSMKNNLTNSKCLTVQCRNPFPAESDECLSRAEAHPAEFYSIAPCLETLLFTSCTSGAPCPENRESTKGASLLDRRLHQLQGLQKWQARRFRRACHPGMAPLTRWNSGSRNTGPAIGLSALLYFAPLPLAGVSTFCS